MTYQDELEAVAVATSTQVLAALAAYQAGQITLDALIGVVVGFMQTGSLASATVADLSLAAVLTTATGKAVAPLGVGPGAHALDEQRLTKAAETILDDLGTQTVDDLDLAVAAASNRFHRLAQAEVKEAAARAYSAAIAESKSVTGWTRGISANACQLCTWWWRDGEVWNANHPMPTHSGCTCNPIPTVKESAA